MCARRAVRCCMVQCLIKFVIRGKRVPRAQSSLFGSLRTYWERAYAHRTTETPSFALICSTEYETRPLLLWRLGACATNAQRQYHMQRR